MGFSIDKIKQEFAQNKKRAGILVVLSLVLVGFAIKAYFEMSPSSAAAATVVPAADPNAVPAANGEAPRCPPRKPTRELAIQRIVEDPAHEAWDHARGRLHFFSQDITAGSNRVIASAMSLIPPRKWWRSTAIPAKRAARIAVLANKLVVTSTVVGSGNSRPVAIVNGNIVTVGDWISEFQVTSIKSREVEFKMDGVTFVAKMDELKVANDVHGH